MCYPQVSMLSVSSRLRCLPLKYWFQMELPQNATYWTKVAASVFYKDVVSCKWNHWLCCTPDAIVLSVRAKFNRLQWRHRWYLTQSRECQVESHREPVRLFSAVPAQTKLAKSVPPVVATTEIGKSAVFSCGRYSFENPLGANQWLTRFTLVAT